MDGTGRVFTYPEQLAAGVVLGLMLDRKIVVTNFDFFSRIESSPLVRIARPAGAPAEYPYIPTRHLEAIVAFWVRGEKIAEATVRGMVALPRKDDHFVDMWGVAEVVARNAYWRNDPAEDRSWRSHRIMTSYSGIKWGSDADIEAFEAEIRNVIDSHA